jgi:Rha family phage regulatory protein
VAPSPASRPCWWHYGPQNETPSTGRAAAAPDHHIPLPVLTVNNGKIKATSLEVAKHFWPDKNNHRNVLQAIENLECSQAFSEHNFVRVAYMDKKGESRPMYEMTRDGFMFLAMGFTGAKAAWTKERFIAAFNSMEEQLLRRSSDMMASSSVLSI